MEHLAHRIDTLGSRLVVVDNLKDVSGKADENSPEIGNVMSNFRQVAESTGAAIILIHHQRKSNGQNSRAGDTLRGHSSIEAALDLALLIQRKEHAETVTLKATKARGADVLPFGAMFTYEHKSGTDELAKVKFYGVPVEGVTTDANLRQTVKQAVSENPRINKGGLSEKVKAAHPNAGINRIGSIIDSLAAGGELKQLRGERGSKLYELAR